MRVVVADDNAILRQAVGALFAQEPDIEIVGEAPDGEEAIALTKHLHPDIVIMDVNMPRVDGIQATRAIHVLFPDTCVIGHSACAQESMAEEMRDAGARDYVPKGAPEQLLLVMRACYARRHAPAFVSV
jgi:two-component system, NarL family, invasion response regulator UvrY